MLITSPTLKCGDLPRSIAGYVWKSTAAHQVAQSLLSIIVFGLSTLPLEIQRRVVNNAIRAGAADTILWLAGAYAAVALAQNGVKLGLNVYRGWVSEASVRCLRRIILEPANAHAGGSASHKEPGVEVAMVLSEADPIGGFVGISMSEPLLQGGILLSIIGYMTWLEPWMAILSVAYLVPQLFFVRCCNG